jgi:hypothetical protein
VDGELLRAFDDDVLALRVPSNHMVVLWPLEEGIELCEKRSLGLRLWLVVLTIVLSGVGIHLGDGTDSAEQQNEQSAPRQTLMLLNLAIHLFILQSPIDLDPLPNLGILT